MQGEARRKQEKSHKIVLNERQVEIEIVQMKGRFKPRERERERRMGAKKANAKMIMKTLHAGRCYRTFSLTHSDYYRLG